MSPGSPGEAAAVLLAGTLVGCAVLLAWPGDARLPPRPVDPGPPARRHASPRTVAVAAAGGVAALVWVVLGGAVGAGVAPFAGAVAWVALSRLEHPRLRRRRERVERDLPHAVDLLAASLAGGQAVGPALARVADAVAGPLGEDLSLAAARLRLGVDPQAVWAELERHPELGRVGRDLARAADSGAPVAEAMARLADDVRREAAARTEARARAVGVKAAVPLGICFLPAFLLTGVVPLVASSLAALLP